MMTSIAPVCFAERLKLDVAGHARFNPASFFHLLGAPASRRLACYDRQA